MFEVALRIRVLLKGEVGVGAKSCDLFWVCFGNGYPKLSQWLFREMIKAIGREEGGNICGGLHLASEHVLGACGFLIWKAASRSDNNVNVYDILLFYYV